MDIFIENSIICISTEFKQLFQSNSSSGLIQFGAKVLFFFLFISAVWV